MIQTVIISAPSLIVIFCDIQISLLSAAKPTKQNLTRCLQAGTSRMQAVVVELHVLLHISNNKGS